MTWTGRWEISSRWVRLRKSRIICACDGMALAGDWVYRRVATEDGKLANADFLPGCCPSMCGDEAEAAACEPVRNGIETP